MYQFSSTLQHQQGIYIHTTSTYKMLQSPLQTTLFIAKRWQWRSENPNRSALSETLNMSPLAPTTMPHFFILILIWTSANSIFQIETLKSLKLLQCHWLIHYLCWSSWTGVIYEVVDGYVASAFGIGNGPHKGIMKLYSYNNKSLVLFLRFLKPQK